MAKIWSYKAPVTQIHQWLSRNLTTSDGSFLRVAAIYDVISASLVDMHVRKSATLMSSTAPPSVWSRVRDHAKDAHAYVQSDVVISA